MPVKKAQFPNLVYNDVNNLYYYYYYYKSLGLGHEAQFPTRTTRVVAGREENKGEIRNIQTRNGHLTT